jgi:hypothetical protein
LEGSQIQSFGTQFCVQAQLLPVAQLPQEPPQPSGPQARPLQLGVQAPHWPLLQDWPLEQLPQEPPQPSGPQASPWQLGVQTQTAA